MIVKNCTDILKEAAKLEDVQVTNLISDELKSKYNDCVKQMTIVPKELVDYEATMVPVFKTETDYLVEFDSVVKYMSSKEVKDVKEAMENIAEANGIDSDDLSLVIETKEYMESVMENAIELSKKGDNSLMEACELSMKMINLMKSQGINVVTTK